MIRYTDTLVAIRITQFQGFCADWPNPPKPGKLLRALKGSSFVVLAIDDDTGAVVGYINALSDGVLYAFIPLLEVLPSYKGQGIGSELVKRMLDKLGAFYAVDLLCDDQAAPFYERFGFQRVAGMCQRRPKAI